MNFEPTKVLNGRTFHLYAVDYCTAEGGFSVYLYAISDEHAAAMVEELKQTARLGGRIVETHQA